MPLVRIDLHEGRPADYRRTVADAVYEAMTAVLKSPADDTGHYPQRLTSQTTKARGLALAS
jgi:hypothetical protein